MGTMYDAVDVAAIPAGAEIVAGYVDGNWPTYNAVVAQFPHAEHVSITVEGAAGARVADLETPNFDSSTFPQEAAKGAAWAKAEIEGGRRPCLYYSKDNAGMVASALDAAGVARADVDYWPADWTGQPHLISGAVATQWASPTTGSGGNFDISETNGAWPGTLPEPVPEPPKPPTPEPAPPQTGGFMPPTIQSDTVSGAVRSAQAMLNLHAPLTIDGVFGPQTEQAVKNFQTIMHLEVDGIVGPQTWTALCAFG